MSKFRKHLKEKYSNRDEDIRENIDQNTEAEIRGLLQAKKRRTKMMQALLGEASLNEGAMSEFIEYLEQDSEANDAIRDLLGD